jgi:hypothetical protein
MYISIIIIISSKARHIVVVAVVGGAGVFAQHRSISDTENT